MTTFLDIQHAVIAKQRLDMTQDLDRVKGWINLAYQDAASRTGGLRRSVTQTLAGYATSTVVPAGAMIREVTVVPDVGVDQGRPKLPLRRVSLGHLATLRSGDATTGAPSHYTVLEGRVELWRVAQGGEKLTVYYAGPPTLLVADTDTPEFPAPYDAKILEFGALKEAADFLRDVQAVQEYDQEYERWIARYQLDIEDSAGDNIEARGLTAHAGETAPDRPEVQPAGRR